MTLDDFKEGLDQENKLLIIEDSNYKDRIVVFKLKEEKILQELHFDKIDLKIIDRKKRELTLPKFEYTFKDQNLTVTIEHEFIDKLNYNGFKYSGIDLETTVVKLFRDRKIINTLYDVGPANKTIRSYFEEVKGRVERHVFYEANKIKEKDIQKIFLREKYSKWSIKKKANYHFGFMLRIERQYVLSRPPFKRIVKEYFSKDFIEKYDAFDSEIYLTLKEIARMTNVKENTLLTLITLKRGTDKWKEIIEGN